MLPQALDSGVSYFDFWNLNAISLKAIIDSYHRKNNAEALENDTLAWNIGRYVLMARIASPAMGKGKQYPKQPLLYESEEKRAKIEKENLKNANKTAAQKEFEMIRAYFQQIRGSKNKNSEGDLTGGT